jgi:hypothetical protein
VLTHVIPIIIITETVGVSVSNTGIISTRPGTTTFDPTAADNFCLNAPNNVPEKLFLQSPLFNPATFDFGGTIVGTTEYSDAFQRGNFWGVLGENGTRGTYHTLVSPVKTLNAIVLRIPAKFGTTLPLADFPSCGPWGLSLCVSRSFAADTHESLKSMPTISTGESGCLTICTKLTISSGPLIVVLATAPETVKPHDPLPSDCCVTRPTSANNRTTKQDTK